MTSPTNPTDTPIERLKGLSETLRKRYTPQEPPPCIVCGHPLRIQSAGGGCATVWGCDGLEADPDNPGRLRTRADYDPSNDHYGRSRWAQYRLGDSDVLDLLSTIERLPSAGEGERLKWHVPDNLRWLADQSDRPSYMPCGMLTGAFLICVANEYERLATLPSEPLPASQQDQGVTPSGPGCQPTASAAGASSQSGIPNADLLRMDYINSLPQPFIARFYGGDEWPMHDIDVQTGLLRIDVCGKLEAKHIGDVRFFVDANGVEHDADDFYEDAASGIVAATAGETEGLDERSEQSPVAKPDAQPPAASKEEGRS
jgi:hypothetical protein